MAAASLTASNTSMGPKWWAVAISLILGKGHHQDGAEHVKPDQRAEFILVAFQMIADGPVHNQQPENKAAEQQDLPDSAQLKTAYDLTRIRMHSTSASLPDGLRFVGLRVQSMIQGLDKSITY